MFRGLSDTRLASFGGGGTVQQSDSGSEPSSHMEKLD